MGEPVDGSSRYRGDGLYARSAGFSAVRYERQTRGGRRERRKHQGPHNDAFRTAMTGGRVFMTGGVALSSDVKALVIRANFTEFTRHDPHGEHDFGNFGLRVLIQRGDDFGSAARHWSRSLNRPMAAASPSSRARRYQDAACLGSPEMPRISARLRKPGS